MDAVSQLRISLLPVLRDWEQELRREHPDVTTSIYDTPVGSRTDWNGHMIGIECLLKNSRPDLPDNVALSVSLKHLHTAPSLVDADVVWGHPSGYVEGSILPACIEFSRDHLADLIERLPELFTALNQALRRGRPPDMDE